MIVVHIHGGLGNQMFQYALGRHLSVRTKLPLRLEYGARNPSHLGRFDLYRFQINATVASRIEGALVWRPVARFVERPLHALGLSQRALKLHRVYVQRGLAFDPEVLSISFGVYLVGNWQCERYFSEIEGTIRKDFQWANPPNAMNSQRLEEISGSQSVCVHVRRGDYVTNHLTADLHGACSLEYYEAARALIEQRVASPHYFVFSDDIGWARASLASLKPVTFVDNNRPEDRHEDLRLMAACKHFVVANSSFSWWAAWLSAFPGKIVVSPRRWFSNPAWADNDIVPQSWLRV